MSKLLDNYKLVTEGKLSKSEFLRQARQGFPNYITQFTSYNDAISIFRNKGILTEDVEYQCKGDKFPLESIERGIRWELEEMGINVNLEMPEKGDYKEARKKAIDNLCKDPEYYIKKIACCCDKCEHTQEEAEKKKGKDYKQKDTEGQMKEVKPEKKNLQESAYTEKKKGYTDDEKTSVSLIQALLQRTNPETGKKYTQAEAKKKAAKMIAAKKKKNVNEAIDSKMVEANKVFRDKWVYFMSKEYAEKMKAAGKGGNMLSPAEAATKACMLVRKALNMPNYRPDRDTINSLRSGQGKWALQWFGEKDGKPQFNQSYGMNVRESMNESILLKESITKTITKILSEAATQNLAALSDQNASVQELPGILNNLENIVTEIESFIIKEQAKIQSVFDSIGNIKNQDNIPIGYKFTQPILDSFKKDLEPVLEKVNLDDLKMPEAPEMDGGEGLNAGEPGMEAPEEKQTVFTPKEPLAESKQPRKRYTA